MVYDLSQVRRTGNSLPPRLIFYGKRKTGKSTEGSRMPSPFFILTEDSLTGIETTATPLCTKFADVIGWLDFLIEGPNDYATIVLDTADGLGNLIDAEVMLDHGADNIEDNYKLSFKIGFTYGLTYWRQFLAKTEVLRGQGKAILIISHADIVRYRPLDHDPYDIFSLKLNRKASAELQEWADLTGYVQADVQYIEGKSSKGGKGGKGGRVTAIPMGGTTLHVTDSGIWEAGNRYPMPNSIPFSWEALAPYVQKRSKPAKKLDKPIKEMRSNAHGN